MFLLPQAAIGTGIGDDLVIGGNAAFAGAAAGGLLSGGSAARRVALAARAGAGVVGIAGYCGVLYGLLALVRSG